jgi:hypothetical protein
MRQLLKSLRRTAAAAIVIVIFSILGRLRRGPSAGSVTVQELAASRAPRHRLSRTGRINAWAAALLAVVAVGLTGGVLRYWPDTSGPPVVGPTISAFGFSVDSPDVDAAVRIMLSPGGPNYPQPSPHLVIQIDIDVPASRTVRWTLDLSVVSESISLSSTHEPQPPGQREAELIRAPDAYDMPSPIGRVRA